MLDLAGLRTRLDALRQSSAAVVAAVAVAAAVVVGAFVAHRSSGPGGAGGDAGLPRATATSGPSRGAPAADATGDVVVDVAGAVVRPGVYSVRAGARVTDAVAAAGGAAPDADVDQVNLAAKVDDGSRVYIPRRGEVLPATAATAPAGPVDLNTATVEQLDGLPGVGPALARAIVDYRTQHHRFTAIDELAKVPGIGPAKLAALRPKVRV